MSTFYPIGGIDVGDLDLVTAEEDDVLEGKVIVDKDGNPLTGKMPNQGAIKQTLGINGSYSIPRGFHSGYGKVSQSLPTLDARTYTPGRSDQVIEADRWLKGKQIIKGDADLIAANIKKGVSIFGITGTFEGWVPVATDLYYNGQNPAGFKVKSYSIFENTQITCTKDTAAFGVTFTKEYDVKSYSRLIIEGNIVSYVFGDMSGAYHGLYNYDSTGKDVEIKTLEGSVYNSITIDISQVTNIKSGAGITCSAKKGSYIRRIRLE